MYFLNEDLHRSWQGEDPFALLQSLDGEVYRQVAERKTFLFQLNGKSYFAKVHRGVGWKEIFKNLLLLRLPIISARNEWLAIQHLQQIGIDTMTIAAFGERGRNPATRDSFIVTEALLDTVSLEDYCKDWNTVRPSIQIKRELINRIANISRTVHQSGLCHRDFYLCHFLLHDDSHAGSLQLSLIDLHRALIKKRLTRRWVVKDIASLYYSAMHLGLSQRDLYRFMRCYEGTDLRSLLATRTPFWNAVNKRAMAMYDKQGSAS